MDKKVSDLSLLIELLSIHFSTFHRKTLYSLCFLIASAGASGKLCIHLKLLSECINNGNGYEKNTNYVKWNDSLCFTV